MSTATTDQILNIALSLAEHERARVALALIESLDAVEAISAEEHEALWLEEVQRRWRDFESGVAKSKPAAEVFAEARNRLKR